MDAVSWALQIAASALCVVAWWLIGNKHALGPAVAFASEAAWTVLFVYSGLWGLLPLCIFMLCLHVRNTVKWRRDGAQP